ncbi:MAG: YdcF family protein [Candidatus Saccharimonadales bacterium]
MKVSAILVLGGGITSEGTLTRGSMAPVRLAVERFNEIKPTWLIMSGGFSYKADFRPAISEAQAMKDYAVSLGVLPDKILTEAESKNTFGNILFTKLNLLEPLKIYDILVIGTPGHSNERLEYVLAKVLGNSYNYNIEIEHIAGILYEDRELASIKKTRLAFDDVANGNSAELYRRLRKFHRAYKS